MPKKPPPNGYYFFMKDYKAREERLGRRFPNGMKDVAELASDEWKSLSQEEKDEYNRIAKEHRNDPRPNIPKKLESKFNSVGISFAQLERERLAKEAKILQRKDFIHSLVNDMNIEELKVHNFYLIHVNYFCKTDHDEYFPAELAISEFSLLNGVQKVFHRFLHPGQIPTGYASEVKDHSDKYHRIPWDFVRGENKYDTIYRDIRDFLKGKYGKSDLPPLFTMYDNLFDNTSLSAAKATLETLWESANYIQGPSDDKFQVYPLPHFFHELKKKCLEATNSGELSFPNDVLAETELRKDTYHFSTEMACKFHQEEDVIAFCSQSYVIRWVHIMRDHCCESLGINIFQKPNHYASDTQALPRKLDALSLKDEQDDEEEEEEYDDCKSTRSGYSTATYFTDKSVDFRSVTGKSSVKSFASTNQSSSATPSFASALSNSTTRENSWASASQPKQAPALDNKNFPSLGRGRRMELGRGMANLRLKK